MGNKSTNVTKIDIPTQAFWKRVSGIIYRSKTVKIEFKARGFGLRFRHRRIEKITQVERPI
jgi:hypothetical protein